MRRPGTRSPRPDPMAAYRTAYLMAYNTLQGIGWSVAVGQTLWVLLMTQSCAQVFRTAGPTVALLQAVALLETAHAATGLVRGSPILAFVQWFGRSNVLFFVLESIPEIQEHWAVASMFVAWGLADMIRYPWYAIALAQEPPAWLTWLRYSAFIILYPWGMGLGEMPLVYAGLPYIEERQLHSLSMPNPWNFAFSYYIFCWAGLVFIMPAALLKLYTYMLSQRRRRLGRAPIKKAEEDTGL